MPCVRRWALLLLPILAAALVAPAAADATVYVARRGWHIDVGMASAELTPPLAAARDQLPGAQYIFFGFGDMHYLLAKNHHGLALVSALWPGAGVILATGLRGSPDQAFGPTQVLAFKLRPEQVVALQDYIWKSLRTSNNLLDAYSEGPYEGSVYFLATPTYSGLHTCNTWAAEALRAAGMPLRSGGVVVAGQLWSQLRKLSARTPAADSLASINTVRY